MNAAIKEMITQAGHSADFLRRELQDANAAAAAVNPLLSVLLLDLIGQASAIEQRIGEIRQALTEAQP